MKRFLIVGAFALIGCNRLNRVTGSDSNPSAEQPHVFNVVACCQDNDGHDNLTWPSFVPAEHVALCKRAATACHDADCQIDGQTYLPMQVDCELDYKIGSQYYKGHGY